MGHYIPEEPELKHVGGNWSGGNPQTLYPDLWAWLKQELKLSTVIDVGCGEGCALECFKRLGYSASGFDGAPRNVTIAAQKGVSVQVHDLTKGPFVATPSDLVWCCEVVAQVEEKYVQNVIDTLALGKYIALTVELPGQWGYHHVNCRPIEYWADLLATKGYKIDVELTKKSKAYAGFFWLATGTIYERVK